MNKQEFVCELEKRLAGLPEDELRERIEFYSEMIDDRIEEGLSEEEAVKDIGSIDSIVGQILSDIPLTAIVKEKIKPKRKLEAWEIVLIILGAPIWLPLLVSVISVVLSIYVTVWAVIISLWAVFVSVAACAAAGVGVGISFAIGGNGLSGVALIAAGLVCAGLAIFLFFGCNGAAKGVVWLTKKSVYAIKKCFVGKECAQ